MMQLPNAGESHGKHLRASTNNVTFKKPKCQDQEFVKSIKTEDSVATAEIVTGTPTSSPFAVETPRKLRPYRGKCLYQSRKCENERAMKRNGKPHNLCEEHRSKQNQHQRKFDAKKFLVKRQRGNGCVEDPKLDDFHACQDDGRRGKYHRVLVHDEAETGIASRLDAQTTLIPNISTRQTYSPTFSAASTPLSMSHPITGWPPSDRRESIWPPTSVLLRRRRESPHGALAPWPSRHVTSSDFRHREDHVGVTCHKSLLGSTCSTVPHHVLRPSHDRFYSPSELVAAVVLAQSQPCAPPVLSSHYHDEMEGASRSRREAEKATPRNPSLLVPSLAAFSRDPNHSNNRIAASSPRHYKAATITSSTSIYIPPRKLLPSLVPSGRGGAPTSLPPVSTRNRMKLPK